MGMLLITTFYLPAPEAVFNFANSAATEIADAPKK